MKAGIVGTLIAVSKIFDGITDVFFGTLIDKTHTKLGKARPWMLYGFIGCAVTLVGVFAIPVSMGSFAQYAWFFISYTLLNSVLYTANNIAYSALTALVTKNSKERVQMGSYRFIFAFATSLLIQSVTFKFVDMMGGGANGWRTVAIIYAVIGLIVNTISSLSVKELSDEELAEGEEVQSQEQKYSFNNAEREIVMTTKGRAMLSGLMFCAHCGCRLTSNVFRDTYTRTDGSVRTGEYLRYICYHKSRKLCECDGQSTYTAAKVDEAVCQAVMDIFSSVTDAPDEVALKRKYDKEMSGHKAKITKLNLEIKRYSTQLEKLNAEIADSLTGDSVYTPEQLSIAINSVNQKMTDANAQLETIQNEIENQKASMEKVRPNYNRFIGWAGEFASATVERKKMIISQLVKRIEISKGYKINIEMNMDYEQFCEGWNGLKKVVIA